MIKLEKTEVVGWEAAIRGMRNPMNSWDKSDSWIGEYYPDKDSYEHNHLYLGDNDNDLMMKLAKSGTDHRKFMRMIVVYVDITAPLYWWKEFDTYKVGTVANSCSTMHKIADKEFTLEDFSCEHLMDSDPDWDGDKVILGNCFDNAIEVSAKNILEYTIEMLNYYRKRYLETKNKRYWWQMIQLLPSSYNQKRTVMLNYEVLANIYKSRKNHKLDEWRELCKWIESLPYSEIITGSVERSLDKISEDLRTGKITLNEARKRMGLSEVQSDTEFLRKNFNVPDETKEIINLDELREQVIQASFKVKKEETSTNLTEDIFEMFEASTGITEEMVIDYRPCTKFYCGVDVRNAIVVELRDKSQLIYIPK